MKNRAQGTKVTEINLSFSTENICVPSSWREWMGSNLLRHTGSRPCCWWCRTSRPLQKARHELKTRNSVTDQEIITLQMLIQPHAAWEAGRAKRKNEIWLNVFPENRFSVSCTLCHIMKFGTNVREANENKQTIPSLILVVQSVIPENLLCGQWQLWQKLWKSVGEGDLCLSKKIKNIPFVQYNIVYKDCYISMFHLWLCNTTANVRSNMFLIWHLLNVFILSCEFSWGTAEMGKGQTQNIEKALLDLYVPSRPDWIDFS